MKLAATFLPSLLLLLGVVGCTDEWADLTVRGSVAITIDGAETGFQFGSDTLLGDDALAAQDGPMAGHCTITQSGHGDGSVDVAIVRPSVVEPGSRAIRSFAVSVAESEAGVEGEVRAELGQTSFGASAGAGCELRLIYVNTVTGQVGIGLACTLEASDGSTAEAAAELHYRGCTVL